ncbi:MAG: tetratricopeptide repeat protein [Rhodospirillales bacterium]|nr:tetratricopeptide repeat protein [Rhodospirillales bacterium]
MRLSSRSNTDNARKRMTQWLVLPLLPLILSACEGTFPAFNQQLGNDGEKPSQSAQFMRIAETTRSGGDLASAANFYQRAHLVDLQNPAPLIAMGETLFAMDRPHESAEAYYKAINLDGKNANSRTGYGNVLIALGKADEAIAQFEAALTIAPLMVRAHNGLGVALDLAGRHDEAKARYIKGMEIDPDNLSLRNNLGLSLALKGDFDEAIGTLEAVAANPAASARNRLNLALVYGLSGAFEKAAAAAARDLNAKEIESNLAIYRVLRDMPQDERSKAVLGRSAVGQ